MTQSSPGPNRTAGNEVSEMKVYITVDLEGVAGLVQWDPADREREREFITADANAAIRGAFEAGATEVLVGEAHANMRNIIPEKIDERVRFLSGQPKPFNHMGGLDESFDLALLVAYHSRAGTKHGVMAHTYTDSVLCLRFNGVEATEENILSARYMMLRPLYLVIRGELTHPATRAFLQFVASTEGQAAIRASSTTPTMHAVNMMLQQVEQYEQQTQGIPAR